MYVCHLHTCSSCILTDLSLFDFWCSFSAMAFTTWGTNCYACGCHAKPHACNTRQAQSLHIVRQTCSWSAAWCMLVVWLQLSDRSMLVWFLGVQSASHLHSSSCVNTSRARGCVCVQACWVSESDKKVQAILCGFMRLASSKLIPLASLCARHAGEVVEVAGAHR